MTNKDNGGPAFPRNGDEMYHPNDGMSLRDWFAGQIIGPLIACNEKDFTIFANQNGTTSVTALAYALADKMLEARK